MSSPITRTIAVLVCLCAAVAALSLAHLTHHLGAIHLHTTIPTTFAVWDTQAIHRHGFLAFSTPDDFQGGRVEQNKGMVWFLFLYAGLKPLNMFGVSYATGQHLVPFLTFGAILLLVWTSLDVTALVAPSVDRAAAVMFMGLAILSVALVGTLAAFWAASIIGNPEDQNRLLVSVAFAYVSVLDFHGGSWGRAGWIITLTTALLAPMYAPLLIATLWILGAGEPSAGERTGLRWPAWKKESFVIALVSAACVVLPYATVRVSGFQPIGSDVLYRSGLDGSREYFTSMAQAIFAPYNPTGRLWALTPIPAAALLVAGAMLICSRALGERLLRQLLVATTPALFWIALFPQAVSIHPYLFDFGIIFPAAFCLMFWMTEPSVQEVVDNRRAIALLLYIVLTALVVTNAIDLARVRHSLPLFKML